MLSGFLRLGKDYPLPAFLKKRLSRVMIPALAWMVVYSLYGYIANGKPSSFVEVFRNIVTGPVHYHLWFIYLIIGLYLVYPILRPWVRTAKDRDFWYFFAMCALCAWGYKIIYMNFNVSIGIYFELFTNNCGYFVLGYYLGTKSAAGGPPTNEHIRPWRLPENALIWLAFGLLAVSTAVTAFGTYFLNEGFQKGQFFDLYFYDYLTPNVGIAAIGWFLLIRFGANKKPLLDIEKTFAEASFGVYFAHVLVMDWWGQCGYWHSGQHPFKGIPVLLGLVTIMTFMWVVLLRSLPFGKKIT
jgi:surface polysaccharide O-acyltransferase-like enzyme